MIQPQHFCDILQAQGISFFCGVPDSLLKNLCAYIDDNFATEKHIITANEGNAIALATGHYLGGGKAAMVYMQNSGLGNTINPLTSLTDPQVYSIPMLLVVGWRGEPGVKDEPQHIKQGQVSEQQLAILDIPYVVLNSQSDLNQVLPQLLKVMTEQSRPVALLVRKDCFSPYKTQHKSLSNSQLQREHALTLLLDLFDPQDVVVSTTGKTSREVFEIRQSRGQAASDFLTVGGMGHTSSIAMGVALARADRRVIAIDGDGSMLMHLGALPIIGSHGPSNLVHIVLNNQSHESVGGQPTVAGQINIGQMALASGYQEYWCVDDEASLKNKWSEVIATDGPVLLEVKIAIGSRDDLGRPSSSPIENKRAFMQHVGSA
ncbi:phosphonopyruvate decarboxylase [uncultured Paraglaciecola sp.]|uniref:phosphonopyruvate decarboxylase n=1 Tax=uncultured Paraglaciecola sp. TaxID=1765024 RepID=UPI002618F5A5|nr:phosphonopyruvate decarboxylase [uncultured Paraglaciecola sp.]